MEMIRHICSAAAVIYPMYGDLKEKKIPVVPEILFLIIGIGVKIWQQSGTMNVLIPDLLPGILGFMIAWVSKERIGYGDALVILVIGCVENAIFSIKCVMIANAVLCVFAMLMLAAGRLKPTSCIAGLPFLAIGYIGAWVL